MEQDKNLDLNVLNDSKMVFPSSLNDKNDFQMEPNTNFTAKNVDELEKSNTTLSTTSDSSSTKVGTIISLNGIQLESNLNPDANEFVPQMWALRHFQSSQHTAQYPTAEEIQLPDMETYLESLGILSNEPIEDESLIRIQKLAMDDQVVKQVDNNKVPVRSQISITPPPIPTTIPGAASKAAQQAKLLQKSLQFPKLPERSKFFDPSKLFADAKPLEMATTETPMNNIAKSLQTIMEESDDKKISPHHKTFILNTTKAFTEIVGDMKLNQRFANKLKFCEHKTIVDHHNDEHLKTSNASAGATTTTTTTPSTTSTLAASSVTASSKVSKRRIPSASPEDVESNPMAVDDTKKVEKKWSLKKLTSLVGGKKSSTAKSATKSTTGNLNSNSSASNSTVCSGSSSAGAANSKKGKEERKGLAFGYLTRSKRTTAPSSDSIANQMIAIAASTAAAAGATTGTSAAQKTNPILRRAPYIAPTPIPLVEIPTSSAKKSTDLSSPRGAAVKSIIDKAKPSSPRKSTPTSPKKRAKNTE